MHCTNIADCDTDIFYDRLIKAYRLSTAIKKNNEHLEKEMMMSDSYQSVNVKISDKSKQNNEKEKTENIFYNDNNLKTLLSFSKYFRRTIKEIYTYMKDHDFNKDSSVMTQLSKEESARINNELYLTKEINLLQHTLNCANVFIDEVYANRLIRQNGLKVVELMLLIILFHDFGKSSVVRKKVNMTSGDYRHDIASAEFIKIFLNNKMENGNTELNKETIDFLADIVSCHHNEELDSDNIFLITLREIDNKTREMEKKYIKQKYLNKKE